MLHTHSFCNDIYLTREPIVEWSELSGLNLRYIAPSSPQSISHQKFPGRIHCWTSSYQPHFNPLCYIHCTKPLLPSDYCQPKVYHLWPQANHVRTSQPHIINKLTSSEGWKINPSGSCAKLFANFGARSAPAWVTSQKNFGRTLNGSRSFTIKPCRIALLRGSEWINTHDRWAETKTVCVN